MQSILKCLKSRRHSYPFQHNNKKYYFTTHSSLHPAKFLNLAAKGLQWIEKRQVVLSQKIQLQLMMNRQF
jgi:hypothetical protein